LVNKSCKVVIDKNEDEPKINSEYLELQAKDKPKAPTKMSLRLLSHAGDGKLNTDKVSSFKLKFAFDCTSAKSVKKFTMDMEVDESHGIRGNLSKTQKGAKTSILSFKSKPEIDDFILDDDDENVISLEAKRHKTVNLNLRERSVSLIFDKIKNNNQIEEVDSDSE